MKHTTLVRGAAAALTAATLALIGSPSMAAGPEADNVALVNPDADTELLIHKILGTPSTTYGDGTAQTITGPRLAGVQFDVYRVGYGDGAGNCTTFNAVDLTTNDGWTDAAKITGYVPTAVELQSRQFTTGGVTYCLSSPTPTTTDSTGVATFNTGGIGLFLAAENLAASGDVTIAGTTDVVSKSTISPSRPFFVTLPMTDPGSRSSWMYTVNVYPKSQSGTVDLKVLDKGTQTSEATGVGATHNLVYTITSDITNGLTGPEMGIYTITDILDARLAFDNATVVLSDGTTTIPLIKGTGPGDGDYYVQVIDNANGTTTVVVHFNPDGLVKLADNPDFQVVTTIEVHADQPMGSGTISNTVSVIPDQAYFDANSGAGMLSNTVQSLYGSVEVTKTDANDTLTLSGAEFAVYQDPNDDGVCEAGELVAANQVHTPVATDGAGVVRFDGLQVSDFYNGTAVVAPDTELWYCLVETKAPSGYNLNPEPISFQVNAAGISGATLIEVRNELANLGNQLPLTGGQGTALISLVGLLLVLGGLGYYAVSNRRRREDEPTAATGLIPVD